MGKDITIEDFEAKQLLLGKIVIHIDYSTGNEVSFIEGQKLKEQFVTHCLEFFANDYPSIVLSKETMTYIDVKELMSNKFKYTDKNIRREHNIRKLLLANSFLWREIV